jgi:hypothetical protein
VVRHSDGKRRFKIAGWVWFVLICLIVVVGSIILIHLGGSK